MKKYVHRAIERQLISRSREFPIVVLTGPRQTGKSTLLKRIFTKHTHISLDNPTHRKLAVEDPALFLEGLEHPVILDEIQYAPQLLTYIKLDVDQNRSQNGRYILTGSQMFPLISGVGETLAGRASLNELLAFSIQEMRLKKSSFTAKDTFSRIFNGFYPDVCIHKVNTQAFYNSYLQTYLERDLRQIKAVHDLVVFQKFLELLAARVGNLLNTSELAKEAGISHTTIKNWLSILESTRIVYLLRPFAKNITKRVVKSPKLYFTDTGLLAHILRYPSAKTLQSSIISGAIFENFIIAEVLKYRFNYNRNYELYFFRDSNKNEIDLIIDEGETIIACEIKSTKKLHPQAVGGLKRLGRSLRFSKGYIVSHMPDQLRATRDIQYLPWWKWLSMLKQ